MRRLAAPTLIEREQWSDSRFQFMFGVRISMLPMEKWRTQVRGIHMVWMDDRTTEIVMEERRSEKHLMHSIELIHFMFIIFIAIHIIDWCQTFLQSKIFSKCLHSSETISIHTFRLPNLNAKFVRFCIWLIAGNFVCYIWTWVLRINPQTQKYSSELLANGKSWPKSFPSNFCFLSVLILVFYTISFISTHSMRLASMIWAWQRLALQSKWNNKHVIMNERARCNALNNAIDLFMSINQSWEKDVEGEKKYKTRAFDKNIVAWH